MLHIYLLGIAMGLYAAAMPGPINLEVVRRALSRGPRLGLAFGLGASSADVIFVLLSSLGALTIINLLPPWGKAIMWLTGSVILFWLGITGLRAKGPAMQKRMVKVIKNGEETHEPEIFFPRASIIDMVKSYAIGLALTLSSPPTIMFWLFNGLMVASTRLTGKAIENASVPYLLAAGVGTSCALWVTGAVTVVNRFHRNLRPETYVWVERIAGSALCCFGGYALIEAVRIMAKFKHWG